MYTQTIKSKNHEIISTGSSHTFNEDPLTIEFGDGDEKLAIKLVFINDDTDKSSRQIGTVEGNTLTLKSVNFNSPLGTGNVEPVGVGTLSDRNIYFIYSVFSATDSRSKLVHYTLFIENSDVKK